jgi:hypothetical protein
VAGSQGTTGAGGCFARVVQFGISQVDGSAGRMQVDDIRRRRGKQTGWLDDRSKLGGAASVGELMNAMRCAVRAANVQKDGGILVVCPGRC